MPGLSPHLMRRGGPVCLMAGMALLGSCTSNDAPTARTAAYPSAPHPAQAVRLGNLRGRVGATPEQRKLSLFLFGSEPEPLVDVIKPAGMAAAPDHVLVCDSGFAAVMTLSRTDATIRPARLEGTLQRPVSVSRDPDGSILVADRAQFAVVRFDHAGRALHRYALPERRMRPADAETVGDEVWVTNSTGHTIEVFARTGAHLRTLGERGNGPGQFGMPLGLDYDGRGRAYVVDMLNNRVQVFDTQGTHLGQIGRAGNLVGSFGRPRDVAVGPDDTVFVVDAASQRVHAFDPDGRPLLAFGGPIDGRADLAVPRGIAVVDALDIRLPALPADFEVAYYVLVSEQLNDPGVRVYAWRRRTAAPAVTAADSTPDNPHWSPQGCATCHAPSAPPAAIEPQRVDGLCLSCHDGITATAEAHPIGRVAVTGRTTIPAGWPVVDGRLGCLTCHDVKRHCAPDVRRPLENVDMLRAWDPDDRLAFCSQCHQDEGWRVNPHRQLDERGAQRVDSCAFCHTETPTADPAGQRTGQPVLLADGSGVCLTCHARHWDYFPEGHVGAQASPRVIAALTRSNATHIPLVDGTVTCYACHNPHQIGLFPSDSPLGRYAESPADRRYGLRADYAELCLSCHDK